ncbi:hypothetical protein BDR03DRAFT_190803 [Suillus americanus]|nr:hypothetical protein BDR03DRAFT_190803 [Suillus americanus]
MHCIVSLGLIHTPSFVERSCNGFIVVFSFLFDGDETTWKHCHVFDSLPIHARWRTHIVVAHLCPLYGEFQLGSQIRRGWHRETATKHGQYDKFDTVGRSVEPSLRCNAGQYRTRGLQCQEHALVNRGKIMLTPCTSRNTSVVCTRVYITEGQEKERFRRV